MQVALLPRSSIAKKALMAVTGAVWIGYLALHMWGNLHIFQGQAAFNHYAEFLREVGEPVFSYAQVLWVIRIVIVFSLVAHMWSAWDLYQHSRHARSSNYAAKRVVQRANLGSEACLGSEVAQDDVACRIGHETGCRIVRHQPEGKIPCRLAAVSGEMCARRKRQRTQHQHDPDEG